MACAICIKGSIKKMGAAWKDRSVLTLTTNCTLLLFITFQYLDVIGSLVSCGVRNVLLTHYTFK